MNKDWINNLQNEKETEILSDSSNIGKYITIVYFCKYLFLLLFVSV